MGKSQPPVADVDLVDSYARLVGEEVEVVLAGPGPELTDGATVVLHGRGGARHRSTAALVEDDRGRRAVARFRRAALSDGTYAVRLGAGGEHRALGCRLLVQGRRPLVLLWGDRALPSRKPVPHPRPVPRVTSARRARGVVGRLRRAVGRRVLGSR